MSAFTHVHTCMHMHANIHAHTMPHMHMQKNKINRNCMLNMHINKSQFLNQIEFYLAEQNIHKTMVTGEFYTQNCKVLS